MPNGIYGGSYGLSGGNGADAWAQIQKLATSEDARNDARRDPNFVLDNQGDFFSNYSPENLAKLQTLLKPLFDQQRQTLDRAQGNALSDARRSGGAYAASRGYENGNSFIGRAQNQVYGQYAPQYDQLAGRQLEAPLGLVGQKMQFDQQRLQNLFKQRDFSYQQEQNKFGFGDVFTGLLGGGAGFLSGLASGGYFNSPAEE
jgi:hypothetical protein